MLDVSRKEGSQKSMKKSLKVYSFIIVSLLVVGFFFFVIWISQNKVPVSNVPAAKVCGDGTFYGTCSLTKPYYCYNGTLSRNALACGCPSQTTLIGDNCVSKYQTNPKNFLFNYVLNGKNGTINATLYGGLYNYLFTVPESIYYGAGQTSQRSDFILKRMNNPDQVPLLSPIVTAIENLAPTSKVDQARIAISLVQNIPWGPSNKTIDFFGTSVGYSRYPYQVLYNDMGLCGEKSELLAYILRDMGYGVALFYYPQQNHEALGIKCPVQNSLDGTGYCFVETSGPAIISDSNLVYAGGVTLNTTPQLIVVSSGISLPENMSEYSDAKTLESLQNRVFLDPISSHIMKNIQKKYGLPETYNLN